MSIREQRSNKNVEPLSRKSIGNDSFLWIKTTLGKLTNKKQNLN